MKKTVPNSVVIAFVSIVLFSFKSIDHNISIPVDVSKSKIEWFARKIAGKHNGFISISSGTFETNGTVVTGGSFEIDTKSMTDVDVHFKSANRWLMGHLKNNFFQVDKYPTASFIITSVTPIADKFEVVGKLTIKDSTQEIRFPAEIVTSPTTVNATANIKLDRRKFGVNYGSGLIKRMANNAIYNEFELKINLVAGK